MTKKNYEQLSQEYKRYEMTDLILLKANLTGNSMLLQTWKEYQVLKQKTMKMPVVFH